MNLLILGGTRFLGRHLAEQAIAAGHRVSLLHRGRSNPSLFPGAEHLIADRNGDLSVLDGRAWDAVVDTSAYLPRHVHQVADRLGPRAGRYLLVSSISVYADFKSAPLHEDAQRLLLPDPGVETVDATTYGGLKALCEDAAQQRYAQRCLVARPGLLVGPHDPTGRYTWWVRRFAAGGDVLVPGEPQAPVQFIDARDAAGWLLRQAATGTVGTFNLCGPVTPLTMGSFFDTARATLAPDARLHWVSESFLLAQGVAPWSDLPVWIPSETRAFHTVPISRAIDTGLWCRPLAETLRDTWAWSCTDASTGATHPPGLTPAREAALLAAAAADAAR